MKTSLKPLLALFVLSAAAGAQTTLFSEDFESGFANWSMTGLWNAQDASEPCTAHLAPFPSGTNAAWYGAPQTCDFSPSDFTNHYLTYAQPIVLPATAGVIELRFRSHGIAEEDGVWDLRHVEVSTNDGGSWTKAGDTFDLAPGWRSDVFDLTQLAGSTVRLRFRFWAGDFWNNDTIGWLIDDVSIVERPASAVVYCVGDGTWRDCPCNNHGAPGRGCATSFNPAGAGLSATGFASVSADTLEFTADGMSNAAATIVQAGANWLLPWNLGGDGWGCMAGPFVRIRTVMPQGGAIVYPAGDFSISRRGLLTQFGGQRFYFVRYRNAASFCTSAAFNVTNGLSVFWRP